MQADTGSLILDSQGLTAAVETLSSASSLIDRIVRQYGQPPLWTREPGFASIVYAILEQQVSLASARAVYDRLTALAGTLNPSGFLQLEDEALRQIGFSGRKIEYCRELADRIVTGRLDLDALASASDEEVRESLVAIRGIGRWTADVYLLHSLGRPDIWPVGDLALRVAVGEELALAERPRPEDVERLGEEFRPLRSVAARVFWQGYLVRRGIREVT